jgi:hypothetical protein
MLQNHAGLGGKQLDETGCRISAEIGVCAQRFALLDPGEGKLIDNVPDSPLRRAPQKGTKAPQAAGKIHTDFEKGFIMAEVMKFDDFKEEGSENAVKVQGFHTTQVLNLFRMYPPPHIK